MKQEFVKQPKTRLVNIYLTEVTQNKLKDLMNKYHVSLSAMVTIACELGLDAFCTQTEFYDKSKSIRTVIKPRWFREHPLESRDLETRTASNILYIITCKCWFPFMDLAKTKEAKDHFTNVANKNWNKFISACQKENEKFWDYNARYRATVRARKQYEREYGNN